MNNDKNNIIPKYGSTLYTIRTVFCLSSWHQHCVEGPRLHHGEVRETAVHSMKHEAMCASGDVCASA